MHVFKTESVGNEHWRLSVDPEFPPATSAFVGTDPQEFPSNSRYSGARTGNAPKPGGAEKQFLLRGSERKAVFVGGLDEGAGVAPSRRKMYPIP
jgi:hypothetical protein